MSSQNTTRQHGRENGHVGGQKLEKKPGSLQLILGLFTPAEKRRGLLVLLMMIAMAGLETVGVASILPFLAVLGNPNMVAQNEYLAFLYELGGFTSVESFLFGLGLAAFGLVVGSSLLRAVTQHVLYRFVQMRAHSVSIRLLEGYIRRPYAFFLQRNSADLSKTILSETQQLVTNIIRPVMQIVAYSLVVVALVILLVVVDPVVAVLAAVAVTLAYALIFLGVRAILGRLGVDRLKANQERFTAANEALGGIKDLKVLGRESLYLQRFQRASARFASHQATSLSLSVVPRHLVEAVGFGGILALTLVLMDTRHGLGEVLPILGIYAFAGYRLLPAAQQVYAGFASLRFGLPALDAIYADLQENQRIPGPAESTNVKLSLEKRLRFEGVSFTYAPDLPPVLRAVDLEISVNTTVGFVGSTGAGKTTAVDLILGLLEPTEGRILIDDVPLTRENVRAWQRQIGYVPQHIYLADASVAENIAFGLEQEQLDQAAVERAARLARIHDFVVDEMPQGYATLVGERGVRLSGGQRQRIGIARALYHDPAVLVLDEATSALDNATESAIMSAVQQLSRQKTIIMIAHRLSTVEKADSIVLFEQGGVKAQGQYKSLLAASPSFRAIAEVASEP